MKLIIILCLFFLLLFNIYNFKNIETFNLNNFYICSDNNCEQYIDRLLPFLEPLLTSKKLIREQVQKPDILILSHFCEKSKIIKREHSKNIITFSGETYDVNEPKSSINFKTIITNNKKDVWFPQILYHFNSEVLKKLSNRKNIKPINKRKHSLLYINSNCTPQRDNFFKLYQKLSGNKGLSLGKCLNTNKNNLERKYFFKNGDYFQDYKFIIAMENSSVKGYCTEKILNAFLNGAIPIYWGCSDTVSMFFNPETYIDLKNYKNEEECIKYILTLENDKSKMEKMQNTNIFKNNKIHPMLNYRDTSSQYNIQVREKLKEHLKL